MTITTMAYEDGAGIDFPTLRAERRARVLAALAEHDIDVLMLGRQGNARYVAGHRPLWRAVVTGWGPVCVLVREDDAVHLLVTTWDDGVPPDIPHERLSGLVWNPELIRANVARIDGLSTARRIAVDGMSASMAALLRELAPNAELVDGEALMRPLRAAKLPGEIDCIRTAIALAEGALYETAELVAPAVREADLKGVFHAALTRNGLNRAASEGTFCATPRHRDGDGSAEVPLRLRPSARTLVAGELVALSGAAHHAGYEGAVARTRPVTGPAGSGPTAGQRALYRRWRAAYDALERACRPGATVAD
ncbi:MAG: aminopeptidase P family protein, partial [Frankia sp.]|nr:aminopeptidase P family protein [Frankia sp.]